MKSRNTRYRVLIIFSLFIYLLLSARSCTQDPEVYHADFHAQGFLDTNMNGEWDDGEPEYTGFILETTMDVEPTEGTEPPKDTVSVAVTAGGVDFSFHAENLHDASDSLKVKYNFKVLNLPEGYVAGSFKEEMVSSSKYSKEVEYTYVYNISGDTKTSTELRYFEEYVYKLEIPIQGEVLETPTPTATSSPTPTPTDTPIPTSTYTPTSVLQAELLKYGSYGGGVDFVVFRLLYAPPPGTLVAYVDYKEYTCTKDPADPTILTCQGPSFPSGIYVDVFLDYNGEHIFSGQIYRAIPATPTKSGPD